MRDVHSFDLSKSYVLKSEKELKKGLLSNLIENAPEKFGAPIVNLIPCLDDEFNEKKNSSKTSEKERKER